MFEIVKTAGGYSPAPAPLVRFNGADGGGPSITAEASLRQALSRMLLVRAERLTVVDGGGRTIGTIDLRDLVRR